MFESASRTLLSLAACASLAGAASAETVELDVSDALGSLCSGYTADVHNCDVSGMSGSTLTVTWRLDSAATLNGYDFDVQWDATELTLLSSSQLLGPPGSVPFTVEPDPLDPTGSSAVALSIVGFSTTELFSLTFQLAPQPTSDCQADISWSANNSGLSPASVVLDNPAGSAVDVSLPAACSDGADNDGDLFIDFDGGACAGVPTAQQTAPDPHCLQAAQTGETAAFAVPIAHVTRALLLLALVGAGCLRTLRSAAPASRSRRSR